MTTKKSTPKPNRGEAPRLIQYAPQVEGMRPTFEATARHLAALLETHYGKDALEIDPPGDSADEAPGYIIWSAIQEHLGATFEAVESNDPRFLSTLYVEMRLFIEQRRLELKNIPVDGRAKPQTEALAMRISDFMQGADHKEQAEMSELLRSLEAEVFPGGYEHAELMPKAKIALGRALGRLQGEGTPRSKAGVRAKLEAVTELLREFEEGGAR